MHGKVSPVCSKTASTTTPSEKKQRVLPWFAAHRKHFLLNLFFYLVSCFAKGGTNLQ